MGEFIKCFSFGVLLAIFICCSKEDEKEFFAYDDFEIVDSLYREMSLAQIFLCHEYYSKDKYIIKSQEEYDSEVESLEECGIIKPHIDFSRRVLIGFRTRNPNLNVKYIYQLKRDVSETEIIFEVEVVMSEDKSWVSYQTHWITIPKLEDNVVIHCIQKDSYCSPDELFNDKIIGEYSGSLLKYINGAVTDTLSRTFDISFVDTLSSYGFKISESENSEFVMHSFDIIEFPSMTQLFSYHNLDISFYRLTCGEYKDNSIHLEFCKGGVGLLSDGYVEYVFNGEIVY